MDEKNSKKGIDMAKAAENIKFEYLLPLGTVLTLKGSKHKVMISGYFVTIKGKGTDEINNTVYEYKGVLWPEGDYDKKKVLVFNHESISDIVYYGYTEGIEDIDYSNHSKVDE